MKVSTPAKQRFLRASTRFTRRLKENIFYAAARFRIHRIITENFLRSVPLWLASAAVGGIAVLYAALFARAEAVGAALVRGRPWLLFFLTPVCFVTAWYLVRRFAPLARGSGIPQITAALSVSGTGNQSGVERLLGLRVILFKILSSCILVFGGGAIGREGPTIQISGGIFRFVAKVLPAHWPAYSERVMILTGSAAGLAAAFNTPLGGIVFAIEELSKRHFNSFRTSLLTAVIISGFVAQMLLGPYLYLGYPKVGGAGYSVVGFVLITALLGGILGASFSQLIFGFLTLVRRVTKYRNQLILVSGLGFLMALIAYLCSPLVLGSGKDSIVSLLFKEEEATPLLGPLRFIGPILSFISGGAGGIFAPALAGGASLGSIVAHIFGVPVEQANVIILTGMVGFLSGVTRSPFTSVILVLEMTDRHSLIFFLMLAGLVSASAAWFVEKESLYDRLKTIYLGELMTQGRNRMAESLLNSSFRKSHVRALRERRNARKLGNLRS